MVFMCYGMLRALQTESLSTSIDLSIAAEAPPPERTGMNLAAEARQHHALSRRGRDAAYLAATVSPALNEIAEQMRGNGLAPDLVQDSDQVVLTVPHGAHGVFCYSLRSRGFRAPSFAYAETRKAQGKERRHYRAITHTSGGDQPHDVTGFTRQELINDLLNRYARFRHTRRLA